MALNLHDEKNKWLDWAIEIQSLAQAGMTYGHDVYDMERYERLREISAEMLSYKTDIPVEKVKDFSVMKLDIRHLRLIPEQQFSRMEKSY